MLYRHCDSWCSEVTYDVSTERSKGKCATHVEMSGVEPLQESNVIKTLCLEDKEREREKDQQIAPHKDKWPKRDEKRRL